MAAPSTKNEPTPSYPAFQVCFQMLVPVEGRTFQSGGSIPVSKLSTAGPVSCAMPSTTVIILVFTCVPRLLLTASETFIVPVWVNIIDVTVAVASVIIALALLVLHWYPVTVPPNEYSLKVSVFPAQMVYDSEVELKSARGAQGDVPSTSVAIRLVGLQTLLLPLAVEARALRITAVCPAVKFIEQS